MSHIPLLQASASLKERVKGSGLPTDSYSSPQDLADKVLAALTSAINLEFPIDKTPDPVAYENEMHRAYAESRRRVYVASDARYSRLNNYLQDKATWGQVSDLWMR